MEGQHRHVLRAAHLEDGSIELPDEVVVAALEILPERGDREERHLGRGPAL